MSTRPKWWSARIPLGALLLLATCSCTDYLARRDSLALGAGDAVQTNIVTHTIDPWPRHAFSTTPTTSGDRAARAIERYRNPQTGSPASAPAALSSQLGTGSGTSLGTGSSLVR